MNISNLIGPSLSGLFLFLAISVSAWNLFLHRTSIQTAPNQQRVASLSQINESDFKFLTVAQPGQETEKAVAPRILVVVERKSANVDVFVDRKDFAHLHFLNREAFVTAIGKKWCGQFDFLPLHGFQPVLHTRDFSSGSEFAVYNCAEEIATIPPSE